MPKLPCPTENEEAYVLVEWLDRQVNAGKIACFTHISNETPAVTRGAGGWTKNFSTLARLKKIGVRRGAPDYIIVLANGKGILFVELKRLHGSEVKPEQKAWNASINLCVQVESKICKGAKEAIDFITPHL